VREVLDVPEAVLNDFQGKGNFVDQINELFRNKSDRRGFLTKVAAAGVGTGAMALLAGCGGGRSQAILPNPNASPGATPSPNPNAPITDADILNFALNLEYLEAEYYLQGALGRSLSSGDIGSNAGAVTIKSNPRVNFTTDALRQYAEEIAFDEEAHVKFLRSALGGAAVARPAINLQTSFNAAAAAAGIGPSFDPFANELNFLLGAFIFEDVGVTAYKGAARLIQNKDFLEAAAGILGVEAYHSGSVRTQIFNRGSAAQAIAQQISDLRDAASGAGDDDQGVVTGGSANIVPTDNNGLAYSRTTSQVLRIVYLTANGNPSSGGFFPNGLNGAIRTAS
jgi:hypothetical protein